MFLNIRVTCRFTSVVCFALGVVSFSRGPLLAQTQDASRWGNVSAWTGKVLITGNGTGAVPGTPSICSSEYSNNQIISLSPETKGQFPQWLGLAGPEEASLSISATISCPKATCLTTIAPLGGFLSDEFGIQVDPAQGKYNWTFGSLTNAAFSTCGALSIKELDWGPVGGPSGGPIPYLGATYPLPSHGLHLKMTIPTYTDANPTFPASWNISWDFSPVCKIDTAGLNP
jgi:hypothetical protein